MSIRRAVENLVMLSKLMDQGVIKRHCEWRGGRMSRSLCDEAAKTFLFPFDQIERALLGSRDLRQSRKNALGNQGEACDVPHVSSKLCKALE